MKGQKLVILAAVLAVLTVGIVAVSDIYRADKAPAPPSSIEEAISSAQSSGTELPESDPESGLEKKESDFYRSDATPPSEEKCLEIQKKVLGGCTEEEKETAIKNIHEYHMYLEGEIINHNLWDNICSPELDYWQIWERTGEMKVNGVPIINNMDGDTYIDAIETTIGVLGEENPLTADLRKMQEFMREGVLEHDVTKLYQFHQMIHDCDYWVLNYPIYFDKIAPPDWSGVERYYGTLEVLS